MNERIEKLARQSGIIQYDSDGKASEVERFAELIVAECVDKIETYRIPVGNGAADELACEWTYDALKKIRDDIQEHFGIAE